MKCGTLRIFKGWKYFLGNGVYYYLSTFGGPGCTMGGPQFGYKRINIFKGRKTFESSVSE